MEYVLTQALDSHRVLVSTCSRRARLIAALLIATGAAALVVLVAHRHQLAWSLSLLAAVILLARGVYLGRPVTNRHAVVALAMALVAVAAHLTDLAAASDVLVATAGGVVVWPLAARPDPEQLESVCPLIDVTHRDPLAPFAMQATKCLFFNDARSAALAYRTRLGFAVVSGDPVGDPRAYRALVGQFALMCHRNGWRIMVLGCGERQVGLWRDVSLVGQSLKAIPIGRDVVVDVAGFAMTGRRYRNLRQAVARSHNCGISTEIVAERDMSAALRAELIAVVRDSHVDGRYERGFSMMLGGLLERRYPGVLLAVGRDRTGRVQAFHRYVQSGAGSDVSLDLPWRRPGAPNGIDERLTVDMIAWCRDRGARRVSLAFAAFPEIFESQDRTRPARIYYSLIRLGASVIALESLYRYLRKFHALDRRRYVCVSVTHLAAAALVLPSLEFLPHHRSST